MGSVLKDQYFHLELLQDFLGAGVSDFDCWVAEREIDWVTFNYFHTVRKIERYDQFRILFE